MAEDPQASTNITSGNQSKVSNPEQPPRPPQRPSLKEYGLLIFLLLVLFPASRLVKTDNSNNNNKASNRQVKLTILHLNDVYQLVGDEKGGGLARIATLEKQFVSGSDNTIFTFGGDTLSPSLESGVFKGSQMIDLWNNLGLTVAVLGNHEFDDGNDTLRQRLKESHFTWLASNVIDKNTGAVLGGTQPYIIREVDGVKIGFFGLLTQDTLTNSKPGANIQITDPFATAATMAAQLRAQGAKVIIAITHLGIAQDMQLAKTVKLDLILGGHDHELMLTQSNGTPIYKMGSDARKLGDIEVYINAPDGKVTSINCNAIPVTPDIAEDPRTKAIIDDYEKQLDGKLGVTLSSPLGKTDTDLDALQATVRASESNIGDYFADSFRQFGNADIGLINGGGIRSDTTYPTGSLVYRDVYSILPFSDKVVVIKVTGAELKKALERSVSQVVEEKQDGAFLQVSGLRFVYSGVRPKGSRITSVTVNGQPLDDNKEYSIATTEYIASGSEGYDSFRGKAITTPPGDNNDTKVIISAIQKAGTISPKIDGRITRTD